MIEDSIHIRRETVHEQTNEVSIDPKAFREQFPFSS
jgi:hypothetical protein